jgi:steroid delta-isomerase-like uncharacterized protein
MSAEDNLAMNRRIFEECWNKGNLNALDEVVSSTYVAHDPAAPGGALDSTAFKQNVAMYRSAFPDVQFTLDEAYAVGDDHVVARWTAVGTHSGPLQGLPPTGKRATVTGITISRYANGKSVESYTNWDTLGLLQQIGAIPVMAQAATATETRPTPQ